MINRIVFPIRRYVDGTAAMNRLLAYAKGFAELGVDVWFFFLITNVSEEKPKGTDPKIHFVYLWEHNNQLFRRFRGLGLIANLLSLIRKIRTGDILFIYGRKNYLFAITKLIPQRVRVFCETTEHPEYNGAGLLRKLSTRISLFFIKRIDGLLVISQSLKEYYISKGIKEDSICVVNMFVDSNRFKNVIKDNDEKYIAYCGYVSTRKDGVDILIKAFSKLHMKHPDYLLYIIGRAGFPEPLSYFKELAVKCGVRDSVVFTGEVSANQMPQLLVNAEFLVLARPDSLQARNGFPTKLGEYLSTGNPVVVTKVGEIPLFIKDRVNGILATESSVEDFADKMIWVVEHPQQSKIIGETGRKLVGKEFSYLEQSKRALSFMIQKCS